MGLTYFKRYKMEIRLGPENPYDCVVGPEFEFVPWSDRLLADHANVKWESFRCEMDAHVFPCLADREGCYRLMKDITNRSSFVPEATWLVNYHAPGASHRRPCGTIQGMLVAPREGAIQNLGVHPEFRDRGIGRALLFRALEGFRGVGCSHVQLEVTVQNTAAIRLYDRLGFRHTETVFKVAEVAYS